MRPAVFSGPERRHRTRYKVRIPFVLKGDSQEVRGVTRNVSILGISAFTDGSMPASQPVECHLNLAGSTEAIVAVGTIIRCDPALQPNSDGAYEVGVFFKQFQGNGESILSEFLQQIGTQEEDAIKSGYILLKQKQVARKKKKRLEAIRKRRRQEARLRKKKRTLKKQSQSKKKRGASRGRTKKSIRS